MDRAAAMEVFDRVVETGSFSAAARSLNLTPSAVSKQISRLEDRLGARLLNRSTRRLSLTEVGAAYHERCQRILADIEEAEQSALALAARPRGTLRINAPMMFGERHVAPHVPAFLRRYPEIRVAMTVTDALINLVEEGVDLVIRIGEPPDSSLIGRRLAPNRRVVCASPGYLEARGRPSSPAALSDHACLVVNVGGRPLPWRFRGRDGGDYVVPVGGPLEGNSTAALHAAALAGIGLAMLPTTLVGSDLQSGRLVAVLQDHVDSDSSIWALYPHNRHLSPKVRAFIDYLVEIYGAEPYWDRR